MRIESKKFKEIMEFTPYQTISKDTSRLEINKISNTLQSDLKEKLKQSPSFCLSTDGIEGKVYPIVVHYVYGDEVCINLYDV